MKKEFFIYLLAFLFAGSSFAQEITFTRYSLDNIGSILIPNIMEKQNQNDNSNIFHSIIFQQKGLNQKTKNSYKTYARIIIANRIKNSRNINLNNNISTAELSEINNEIKYENQEQMRQNGMEIVNWYGTSVVTVNKNKALMYSYIRTSPKGSSNGTSNTMVKVYRFPHDDLFYSVTLSYSIADEKKWKEVMNKSINSFNIGH